MTSPTDPPPSKGAVGANDPLVEEPVREEPRLIPSWLGSERRVPRLVLRPFQEFLETEYGGGIVLLVATAAALIWANSPWSASYHTVWGTHLEISLGPWAIEETLKHWVNDGLMALFFFVVGLEIKRELVSGELRDRRAAALPAVAALGGMVVPALIYLAFNASGEAARGWGIPMATDIAFALGVLSVVGRRIPTSLKSFLLALAIVDDIGAIIVIAIFYSGSVSSTALLAAAGLLLLIVLLQRLQVRWTAVYVVLGLAVWLATLESGVHATIAGVVLGLITPAASSQRPRAVGREAHRIAEETMNDPHPPDADAPQWLRLGKLSREAVSPLARLETLLHPWTSFAIVPLFALANAGVTIGGSSLRAAAASPVALGVLAGLVLGKPIGISLASWIGTRTRIARLPAGVSWTQLVAVSALAGIGFTVSLFITDLAFPSETIQGAAKIAILLASILAGALGALVLAGSRRR